MSSICLTISSDTITLVESGEAISALYSQVQSEIQQINDQSFVYCTAKTFDGEKLWRIWNCKKIGGRNFGSLSH